MAWEIKLAISKGGSGPREEEEEAALGHEA